MSKKVLILAGSPRKGGNSDLLCESLGRAAEENGNSVEKIYLQDLNVGFCRACYGCRGSGHCVQRDDMEALLEKMIAADVIVLATPVYFYSMAGQMKTVIDRTLPRYTEIRGKDFIFIVTAAAGAQAMERTVDSLRGFTDCLPAAKVRAVIYGAGVYQKGDVADTEALVMPPCGRRGYATASQGFNRGRRKKQRESLRPHVRLSRNLLPCII